MKAWFLWILRPHNIIIKVTRFEHLCFMFSSLHTCRWAWGKGLQGKLAKVFHYVIQPKTIREWLSSYRLRFPLAPSLLHILLMQHELLYLQGVKSTVHMNTWLDVKVPHINSIQTMKTCVYSMKAIHIDIFLTRLKKYVLTRGLPLNRSDLRHWKC